LRRDFPRPLQPHDDRNESCNFSSVPESECVAVEWGRAKMNPQFNVTSLSSEPRLAGPNAALSITMRSEINAISGAVDWLMTMIQECNCVLGDERNVEIALREALANAVLHGNHQDAEKKVQVNCRIQFGGEVSIVVKDEGDGFDPNKVPDPTAIVNLGSEHGRGIYLMRALMDEVHFEQGGAEVHMRKGSSRGRRDRR
jgi:serine/threonine-protein kinase RsbW